jgi:hypothetical protein
VTSPMHRQGRGAGSRGQGMVEFSMVVPVFLLLLVGMLEFGFAFTHDQTLAYATREGARTGAAFGDGSTSYPCATANFDAPIIAAVERVLASPGSPIDMTGVTEIDIFLAKSDGSATAGSVNVWKPGSGPTVDGKVLDFKATSQPWTPCSRKNDVNPDALGVSINYSYQYQTPLAGILRFFGPSGPAGLQMSDRTVMNLNPTN